MLLLACLFVGIGLVTAQTLKVTGVVISEEDGQPVVGASVLVKGTSQGTITDMNGNFTLPNVPSSAKTLQVSYIGMQTQEVGIKANVKILLKSDAQVIEEVVVTGYGIQRKASFTGAASMVGKDVIEKRTDPNFVKSLEGAIPGLQMNNSTGMPGSWGAVYVRGRSSLNSGTQPLYVIDGIPVNSDTDAMSSSSNNEFDPMASLNPADIENVTVLKDAAATAIYGSRAANGVIVITTKKGAEGKFNINLDVKQGFVSMANHNMDYANAQEAMKLFANGWTAAGRKPSYQESYDYLSKFYSWDGKSSYDWIDKVTRKGYQQDYNLNIQGRKGDTGYYISMGYLDSKGLVIASDLERFTGRLNVDSKFKMFTLGASASYSYSVKNGFSQSTSGSFTNVTVAAISSMLPFYPFYNEDGTYANVDRYNPLAVHDKKLGELDEVTNQTINLSPYLQVDFGKGIYAKTTLGINITDQREYVYWSAIYNPQSMKYNGLGQQYNSRNTIITWNNILGWNYTFLQKHNINFMLGQEMQKKSYFYEYYAGSDFPFADSGMRDLTTAGSWKDSEYYKKDARLASYFTDMHYSYDEKYYLSASFRRDGSSVFGSDNLWGNFWSVGGKWRITGEEFLKDNPILTNATLRASYGTVGNQDIDWYASRGFYVSGYNYNSLPGMTPESIPNPTLTWEVSKKFDIGFDISFLQRINFSFDFYNEKTTEALFKMPLSRTTGMKEVYQNIGSIRNRGIELALNASILRNSYLNWTAYANLTWNQNRVLKLSAELPIEYDYTIVEVGRPYRQFKLKEYAGVDRETGKPLWYRNEEGSETTSVYSEAAKRYLGSAEAKVFGGLGTNLTWKGLDFALALNYRLGGKVLDTGAQFTGFGMSNRTPLKEVALNSWTPENKDAKYPQYIYGDPNQATQISSRYLYSSNFLRVSNMTLGYTLPVQWTAKAFMQKVRAYISIDNLYTFTASDFIGYNPETYNSGFIAWQYPAVRTFMGGIQVTF